MVKKLLLVVLSISFLGVSGTIFASAEHRLAYSQAAQLEVFVEHSEGEPWCSAAPKLRFQDSGAQDVSVLEQIMPKIGVLLEQECPAATGVTWFNVDSAEKPLLSGSAEKASSWRLQTNSISEQNIAQTDSESVQPTNEQTKASADDAEEKTSVSTKDSPAQENSEETTAQASIGTNTTEGSKAAVTQENLAQEATKASPNSEPSSEPASSNQQQEETLQQNARTADKPEKSSSTELSSTFSVNGWRPITTEVAFEEYQPGRTLTDQQGCRFFYNKQLSTPMEYTASTSQGIKCKADKLAEGKGRWLIQRTDGQNLDSIEAIFRYGMAFQYIYATFPVQKFDERDIWLHVGSNSELKVHYLVSGFLDDYYSQWNFYKPTLLLLTENMEIFKNAEDIDKIITEAMEELTPKLTKRSTIKIVAVDDFEGRPQTGQSLDKSQLIYTARARINRKGWDYNPQRANNYVFEREQRALAEAQLEQQRIAREKALNDAKEQREKTLKQAEEQRQLAIQNIESSNNETPNNETEIAKSLDGLAMAPQSETAEELSNGYNFSVNGWRPIPTEASLKVFEPKMTLTDQNGCLFLTNFNLSVSAEYLLSITKGITCGDDRLAEGNGTWELERTDGRKLGAVQATFKHGIAFEDINPLFPIQQIDEDKIWLYVGSNPELKVHYLTGGKLSSNGTTWDFRQPTIVALTENMEVFKNADDISQVVTQSLNMLTPNLVENARYVRFMGIDNFQQWRQHKGIGTSEHALYSVLAQKNKQKWEFNPQRANNYIFEREQKAIAKAKQEQERLARVKAQKEATKKMQRKFALADEARKQESYLEKYQKINATPINERRQSWISEVVYQDKLEYSSLMLGQKYRYRQIIRVDKQNDDGSWQVSEPYSAEIITNDPLERGEWYRVDGTITFDTSREDTDGFPLSIIQAKDTILCEDRACLEYFTPLQIIRDDLGDDEWTTDKAQAAIEQYQSGDY